MTPCEKELIAEFFTSVTPEKIGWKLEKQQGIPRRLLECALLTNQIVER